MYKNICISNVIIYAWTRAWVLSSVFLVFWGAPLLRGALVIFILFFIMNTQKQLNRTIIIHYANSRAL